METTHHPQPSFSVVATVRRRRWQRLGLALAVIAAAPLLSACGSSDDATGEYTLEQYEADVQRIDAEYRQCMSDNGIDLPENDTAGGNAVDGAEQPDIDPDLYDTDAFAEAEAECSEILADLPSYLDTLTPEELAETKDYNVALQNCVADKGYALPTPESDGNSVVTAPERDDLLPPEGDAFEEAVGDCEQEISDDS